VADMEFSSRREALKFGAKAAILALGGGFIWSLSAKASPLVLLRPPGAKAEKQFLKSCIRCGLCVEACPFDTLKLATLEDGISVGTPYFEPRKIPCHMCEHIPCVPACPTGALDANLVSTAGKLDINKAKMGVAVVDMKNCVAYWGIQCDACYRSCPLIDKALYLEYRRNERTQKHAFLLPVVDSDICTGCGMCERACITEKAAITVLNREVVLGKVGDNYVKGWVKEDERRVDDADSKIKLDIKKATDYLNGGEL